MAESHCNTMDTVQAAMPFLKLMCSHDEPMYLEMVVIHKEIYQNLATISLPFSNGHARFSGIMMPEALYVQCFSDPFQPPINPGKYPDNIPSNTSTQQWSKLLIHHKAAKQVYDTFKAVMQCLQNQVQEGIHKDYLAKLDYPDVGLTNVHKIDLKMVEENRKNFNTPMDPSKPLVVYTKNRNTVKHLQQMLAIQSAWQTWCRWGLCMLWQQV